MKNSGLVSWSFRPGGLSIWNVVQGRVGGTGFTALEFKILGKRSVVQEGAIIACELPRAVQGQLRHKPGSIMEMLRSQVLGDGSSDIEAAAQISGFQARISDAARELAADQVSFIIKGKEVVVFFDARLPCVWRAGIQGGGSDFSAEIRRTARILHQFVGIAAAVDRMTKSLPLQTALI
jgi:hypothetical protein